MGHLGPGIRLTARNRHTSDTNDKAELTIAATISDIQGGLSKSPQLISAFALSAFVIKYTLFTSARLPGNGFSIR